MRLDLNQAVEKILSGEIVAIPTDTVYGLAVLPQKEVSQKLYHLKKRSQEKPFLVLVHSIEAIKPHVQPLPESFWQKIEKLWPGALSLIFPTASQTLLTDASSLGFRIPDHIETLKLLEKTGPLFVTSANISGQEPITRSEELEEIFGKDFPWMLGALKSTEPSTILSYDGKDMHLVRKGALDYDSLKVSFPELKPF